MSKQSKAADATRQAIIDAFWELYRQSSIDRISVRDIAAAAFVHRSTFYRYFEDIQDLLRQAEQQIMDEIILTLRQVLGSTELTDIVSHLSAAVRVMKDQAPMIYHLTGPNGDVQFRDRLRGELRAYFDRFPFIGADTLEMDYLFHVIFNLMLSNLSFWYEHQDACSLEDISVLCRQLFCGGVAGYIEENSRPNC